MARNDIVYWRRRSEKLDGLNVSSMSNFENTHVLVVDDCFINRKLIECGLLKIASCKVTAVDSGLKALQLLEVDDLKVDLIITNYCMPEMTGYELLKKIKESPNFKEIPVIIMSSENILTRIDMCLEEGAKDFIMKPVTLSDIKRLTVYMKKDIGGVEESGIKPSSPPSSPPSLHSSSSFSAPSSPISLDSHITGLKRTYSDRLDHQTRPMHILSSHVLNKKKNKLR